MKKLFAYRPTFLLLLPALLMLSASSNANAQRRDYLTDEEVEIVRDAQQLDFRMEVLMHAADRRFIALGLSPGATLMEKADKWGAAPTGTRLELLDDIKRIIQKAVDDIDNLATRPDSMVVEEPEKGKKPKSYSEVFPKAVHILAAAAKRYQPLLEKELNASKDEKEKGLVLQTADLCEQIISAENRMPAAPAKKSGN